MTGDRVDVSVVVPTYDEAANIAELLRRVDAAVGGPATEVVVVDDSRDDTAAVARAQAPSLRSRLVVIHRAEPEGGLSGAVVAGLRAARGRQCAVLDGDLQHPPEVLPALLDALEGADVAVASRYTAGGAAEGLSGWLRHGVSRTTTLVTKAMFPTRLHTCSDPMTGFFALDLDRVDLDELRPKGFKILLEVLVRRRRRIREVPFAFGARTGGSSKASLRQGLWFLWQLVDLRFGRMSGFALIGALGAVANVAIVSALVALGMSFLPAAVIAAEATIVGNFLLQERFVFADLVASADPTWRRFLRSALFNNTESAIRIAIAWWLVAHGVLHSAIATAVTLAVAFVARFVFHALVVYRPREGGAVPAARERARV
ncbi:glycosyltransferase [Klenkia taihuensis]|uniref:Dolichol-phosphate mannosyltransferase n=1 Tax=Klenkia taihuensis TaxID=1225127 RepID=A0A1I1JNE5_9ACTN|nr:glycosyltransferase [Klenkia taihuensis]GHE10808.1 dolichol monophosphate mannose synthase [Klenkia taihuensis]SFC49915.1 dolichol-phosphate mannosyltransferase [Klenkia taihuensis]